MNKAIVPRNEAESTELFEYLKKVDNQDLTVDERTILRTVFEKTEYAGMREIIARIMIDLEDEEMYSYLIRKVKACIHTKNVAFLVYCCSFYECSEDLQLFIDIIILKPSTDRCIASAVEVFKKIENIPEEERIYALNKLLAYRETLESYTEKYEDVSIVIDWLTDFTPIEN
ncbi:hypothetical protein [Polluticoccus soli]|uniref:hypothetical protein n=1 Tax=Polluticoccus soli TaxID=3034150 RepID=UPI0023E2BE51|nr:hypothetical protein [Flavipsychrobacter sp. JY13-12]